MSFTVITVIMEVKHVLTKNYLLDYYLNNLDKKVEKGKNSKTEYIILFLYLGLIVLTIVTFNIDNLETRLMLFDITIPFGSHRIYNTFAFVIVEILGLVIFKYYHLTTDKRTIFWTVIAEIFRQKYSRWTILFKLMLKDLGKILKLAEILNVLILIIGGK